MDQRIQPISNFMGFNSLFIGIGSAISKIGQEFPVPVAVSIPFSSG